jgi:hypothetical protein
MNKNHAQELSEDQKTLGVRGPVILPKRVLQLLDRVTADDVRYIKLGKGNNWWPLALKTNTLRLGFRDFDFKLAIKPDWQAAKNNYAQQKPGLSPGKVTSCRFRKLHPGGLAQWCGISA